MVARFRYGQKESYDHMMQKFECQVCGYIYDPSLGDPDGGINPGTEFTDLPASWHCPVCGSQKSKFIPLEG